MVALLAAAVVLVLPGRVPEPEPSRQNTAEESPAAAASSDLDTTPARQQAEQALQQALRLQAALQLANAPAWGEPEWSQVSAALASGDRQFGERRFADAGQSWQQAVTLLQALQDSREVRLQQALAAGQAALEADQSAPAIVFYEQALLIDADHAQAQSELARARVRPQVLDALRRAADAEQHGDLDAAIAAVQTAVELDTAYPPAQTDLARLEEQKAGAAFRRAMNEALNALQRAQFAAAEQALNAAAAIDPQHPSLQDTRQRLAAARQQAALQQFRDETRRLVGAEHWEAAVRLYRQALQIDANAAFARQGLARAEQRAAVNRQFDHYLDDPSRLYSGEPLANAERLLETVAEVPASEPGLRAKRERLAAQVSDARQPLQVTLRSDGQTEVVIFHVGRLGRFTDQTLKLQPGTYTAVGSRPGYRDVRRVFTLRPKQAIGIVEIRCEEPV